MKRWHWGPEGFSERGAFTQLHRAIFSCVNEICSNGWVKKQPYADIENQASEERCLETKAIHPIGAYGPVRSFLPLGTSVYGSEWR